jgi:hypothetical protein
MIESVSNWYRYLSFVAYEAGEPLDAARLLRQSVQANPVLALKNPKTLMLGAAIASNYLARSFQV